MNQLKSDVEGLKSSVDEIKQLLRSIINATWWFNIGNSF
jgi:hypothetical protein